MKKLFYPFLFILLIVIAILILKLMQSRPVQSEVEKKNIPVNTINAKLTTLSSEFIFYGNIKGISEIDIVSKLDGQVTAVSKKLFNASKISKGEVLFEIDSLDYREGVVEKKAILKDLKSEMKKTLFLIKEAEKQLLISNKNYSRKKKLLGNTVSKKALEDAELNLSIAKSNLSKEKFRVESLTAQIKKANSRLNISRKNLTKTKYKAPFNGKVFNNKIDKGVEIISGDKLAKLVNTDKLEVKFFVGESTFTKLGAINSLVGRKVKVLWAKSDYKKEYNAIITKIDGVINQKLAGLNMYAELEKLDDADPIRPGVFVEMIVKGAPIPNAFLIPENAIYEEKYIYILKESKPVKVDIILKGNIKNKKIAKGNIANEDIIIIDNIPNIEEIQKIYSIKN